MKVLVVGGGGREHALAWKIGQSPRVDQVFVAPGNAGTAMDAENVDISSDDIAGLVKFAKDNAIDLSVIGPEAPLCAGITTAFANEGLKVFGPSPEAARLEGSKVFCKQMLKVANVPTADFQTFNSAAAAMEYAEERWGDNPANVPVVVKADGLAAGKGVLICSNMNQLREAVERMAVSKDFGSAGSRFVLEERLTGPELSVLAISDGRTILTLPPAQDHKRAYDGDRGPNTGGMGAYCPAPISDEEMPDWIESNVFVPTIHAMKRSRHPFRGILYAGLMMTPGGPKVLEYNVRFGDPECQPLLRLKTDLVTVLELAVNQELDQLESLEWDERAAVCVVMASEGYPDAYDKGHVIRGLEDAAKIPDVKVFHAGTKLNESGEVVTSGGRVLGVTGLGENVAAAKLNAYKAVKCIRWNGAWCRKDIADGGVAVASK